MNHLRQFCMAFVLALTLSSVALAGTIDCPGITQQSSEEATAAGEIQNDITDLLLIMLALV